MKSRLSFLIAAFILAIPLCLAAQEIGLTAGVATFDMKSLKRVNEVWIQSAELDLPYKVVDNFPMFVGYSLRATFPVSTSVELGARMSYYSTGSRVSYADYSGSDIFDQKLRGLCISFLPCVHLVEPGKNILTVGIEIGTQLTWLNMERSIASPDAVTYDNVSFSSLAFCTEPTLRYGRRLGSSPLVIAVSAGYHIDAAAGKLYLKDGDKTYLMEADNKAAKANWSGARAELGFSYRFPD